MPLRAARAVSSLVVIRFVGEDKNRAGTLSGGQEEVESEEEEEAHSIQEQRWTLNKQI